MPEHAYEDEDIEESDTDVGPVGPCALCRELPEVAEFCDPVEHTESVQRLAYALARSVHGDETDAEKASWFLDDAISVEAHVPEGDGWTVPVADGRLTDDDGYVTVNGVVFWLDPNGETGTVLEKAECCEVCGRPFPDEDEVAIHVDEEHTPDV